MVQSGVRGLLNTTSFIYMMLMSEKITLLPPLHIWKIDSPHQNTRLLYPGI